MKKVWLLTTLSLILFFVGCDNTPPEQEVIDDCLIEENCISEDVIVNDDYVPIDEDAEILDSHYWDQVIANKKSVYNNHNYWLILSLNDSFKNWIIREYDDGEYHVADFYIKDVSAKEWDFWIEWFRSVFKIRFIESDKYKEFMAIKWLNKDFIIWNNNKYYFFDTRGDKSDTTNYYTLNYTSDVY